MVTAAGAWYDKFFSHNGKYRVGHSALALVDTKRKKIEYLDFGRYFGYCINGDAFHYGGKPTF